MARHVRIAVALGLVCLLDPRVSAQNAARDRIEREATGQGARADQLFKAGQYAPALTLYQSERTSRKAIGDARYEAYALRGIGVCHAHLGDDEAAIDAFRQARSLDEGRDDKGFEGYDGLLIAQSEVRLGRAANAVGTLKLALPKLDQAIDRDHEADAHYCMVRAFVDLGEPDKAGPHVEKLRTLAEGLDDPRRVADAWFAEALVARQQGRNSLAFERMDDAMTSYLAQDRPIDVATATRQRADLSYRLGHPEQARLGFVRAADLHAKLGDTSLEAADRLDLASIEVELGHTDDAIREARRATDGFRALDDRVSVIEALVVLAEAQSHAKDGLAAATATISEAIDIGNRVYLDDPAEQIRLILLGAELEHRLGHAEGVTSRLNSATVIAGGAKDPTLKGIVELARARLSKSR